MRRTSLRRARSMTLLGMAKAALCILAVPGWNAAGAQTPRLAAPAPGTAPGAIAVKKLTRIWQLDIAGAHGICKGNWGLLRMPAVFVSDRSSQLHVINPMGNEVAAITMPAPYTHIECDRASGKQQRFLGHTNWGNMVAAFDRKGTGLWEYPSRSGVNGAHWGDLDGDGVDEMIVGMNGGGGLHAVSASGKRLWTATDLGNVWNQAVVSAKDGRPAIIFATEAGGTIRVFDGKGNPIRTVRPLEMYFSPISAADLDGKGEVQVVGVGESEREGSAVVAIDPQGKVAWRMPVQSNPASWRLPQFACGDMNADGIRDWAFVRTPGELTVVSHTGERIAMAEIAKKPARFEILRLPDATGLLVVLQPGSVSGYKFQ